MNKQKMLEYHVSLHKEDLWFMENSFILSCLNKRGDSARKIKQKFSTKSSSSNIVFLRVLWVQLWTQIIAKSTYCTILFSFLLLGFGLLQSTELALVFEIETFHSLFFFPIQFPRLFFTSRHLSPYTAASAQYEGCLSSQWQLPKNPLRLPPDDKAVLSLTPSEN